MLGAEHRLRRSDDFAETIRRGRRSSRPLLTVHLLTRPAVVEPVPARAGLVVSKAVGGSVVRSRTSRRLRHLLRSRVAALPTGSLLVVRAGAAAGTATSAALATDLDGALASAARPAGPRPASRATTPTSTTAPATSRPVAAAARTPGDGTDRP